MLTIGVNHKDLVVGENVAAKVYAIPGIKNPIYIKICKYYYVKYRVVKERNKHWVELEFKN